MADPEKVVVTLEDGSKVLVTLGEQGSSSTGGPKPISSTEPQTYQQGFRKSVGETVGDTIKGIGDALNPMSMLSGVAHKDDPETLGLHINPDDTLNTIAKPNVDLTDPRQGGRTIGDLGLALALGRTPTPSMESVGRVLRLGGKAVSKYGPDITRPVKWVGDLTEAAGRELESRAALRMAPSHSLTPPPQPSSTPPTITVPRTPVATGDIPHLSGTGKSLGSMPQQLAEMQEAQRLAYLRGTPPEGVNTPKPELPPETPPQGPTIQDAIDRLDRAIGAGSPEAIRELNNRTHREMVDRLKADLAPEPSHPTKLKVDDLVPASKSKRGAPSATPGLTQNDVQSIGLNPNMRIRMITPEAARIILRSRASRSGLYRTEAELNAAVEAMMEKEGF